jgi:hypothetical protein
MRLREAVQLVVQRGEQRLLGRGVTCLGACQHAGNRVAWTGWNITHSTAVLLRPL